MCAHSLTLSSNAASSSLWNSRATVVARPYWHSHTNQIITNLVQTHREIEKCSTIFRGRIAIFHTNCAFIQLRTKKVANHDTTSNAYSISISISACLTFLFHKSHFHSSRPSSSRQLASINAFRSQMLVNLVHFAHSMFGSFFGVHEIVWLVVFCVLHVKSI